jgi:hypothetical protein
MTLVHLRSYCEGLNLGDVWINPDRIAYLQARYRSGDKIVGTRIFFAGDGMVDVFEVPAVVLSLIVGDGGACLECHTLLDVDELERGNCSTCEITRLPATVVTKAPAL